MQHPNEHTIERVVLGDSTLLAGEREATEAHLAVCPACEALATWLRSFYEEAARAQKTSSPELLALVDRLSGTPRREVLIPYRPQMQGVNGAHTGITVLAAMSPQAPTTARFQTVATLASKPTGTLARIQIDRERHSYHFYLHAEDPERLRGVVVTCPTLKTDLVLDENGQAEFSLESPPNLHEWGQLEVIARWPLARLGLAGGVPETGITSLQVDSAQGKVRVSLARTEREISMEAHIDGADISPDVAVFRGEAGATVLVRLSDGRGLLSGEVPPGPLEIRIYA